MDDQNATFEVVFHKINYTHWIKYLVLINMLRSFNDEGLHEDGVGNYKSCIVKKNQ